MKMELQLVKNTLKMALPITMLLCFSCGSQNHEQSDPLMALETVPSESEKIEPGIQNFESYLPLLIDQKVGVVANQTSVYMDIEGSSLHLVDFLRSQNIEITKVFAPEHGFRGMADAGEVIKDGIDVKTGIPIISLYGSNKKPTLQQLEGLDIVLFDIQDVGARFYTYISTLHYVMEACAEADIPVIILDRPNPNGHYIDGPILEPKHQSFVGMHPVPVVHGMTVGEYAQMINGEGWLKNKVTCHLTVIKAAHYNHSMPYSLPIKPSPNLPNDQAINLYPSLCFFESTPISAGRGTEMQFQIFGDPLLAAEDYPFQFTPAPNEGAKNPKFNGIKCQGMDLRNIPRLDHINLQWLIDAYQRYPKKESFFSSFFTKLAGTEVLELQIKSGMTSEEIRESWKNDLAEFQKKRKKYLLYD
jgi:uncharacterized protein YbbC (DUF1343 family)